MTVNHYAVGCVLRSAWHYDVTFIGVRPLLRSARAQGLSRLARARALCMVMPAEQ